MTYRNCHILIWVVLIFSPLNLHILFVAPKEKVLFNKLIQTASAGTADQGKANNELWEGPILFHQGSGEPVHFILVEKALQKLHLYRYDGLYKLIKSYTCSTGEKHGKKRKEKDEKTPEGIYFSNKVYRDSKITVFGDRAFGLNYPDVFDDLEGNRGSGIFIHGTNRDMKPFSSNGCVVLQTLDIADLDNRIQIKNTPIIIGEQLPFRFESTSNDVSELIPLLKQAMIPKHYANLESEFHYITVLGFQKRIVAFGEILINDAKVHIGFSRLYLVRPAKNLLVIVKREWNERQNSGIRSKAKQ